MLISLGVAQSGQLVGKIGETFGISDLALDTQGVGDKSQVVVSGKITNDLQVKYGVGIFDSLATLTLRYRLMPGYIWKRCLVLTGRSICFISLSFNICE